MTAPNFKPIADYGLLSDCNTSALASRDGAIDWLCMPRFDSPAVFARILDPEAGHWTIAPAERADVTVATSTEVWWSRPRSAPIPAGSR